MLPSVAERPAGPFEEGGGHARRTARADETTEGSGWITTDVATAALGVSPRIVRRYIDRGDLAGRVEE